jgi:hypothetical protein
VKKKSEWLYKRNREAKQGNLFLIIKKKWNKTFCLKTALLLQLIIQHYVSVL